MITADTTIPRRVGMISPEGWARVGRETLQPPGEGEVLVRVACSMISAGTEVPAKRTSDQPEDREQNWSPFGYQNAGRVVEVGPGVEGLEPGMRVACLGAKYALHADQCVVPQRLCALLPDSVSFESASCINLVLTAMQAARRAELIFGERVLVIGAGLLGQLMSQIAHQAGCSVVCVDRFQPRCQTVHRLIGIPTFTDMDRLESEVREGNRQRFDAAILAMGGEGTALLQRVAQLMTLTDDGHLLGRLVIPGGVSTTISWGAAMGNLDVRSSARTGAGYHDPAWELGKIDFPRGYLRWHTGVFLELALQWLAAGRIQVEPLITHRFPLNQIDDAVSLIQSSPEKNLGVLILPDGKATAE